MTPCCGNARTVLQNVILCANKVSRALRPLHSLTGHGEDCVYTRPSVPPCRAPFGSCPAGMVPTSLPEGVTSGSDTGWPAGSCKTQTHCGYEPEPRHGHRELGVAVLLSSLQDEQSCRTTGRGEKNGVFPSKTVTGDVSLRAKGMRPSKRALKSSIISVLCWVKQHLGSPMVLAT